MFESLYKLFYVIQYFVFQLFKIKQIEATKIYKKLHLTVGFMPFVAETLPKEKWEYFGLFRKGKRCVSKPKNGIK